MTDGMRCGKCGGYHVVPDEVFHGVIPGRHPVISLSGPRLMEMSKAQALVDIHTPCCGVPAIASVELFGFDGADTATVRVEIFCSKCQLAWVRTGLKIAQGWCMDGDPNSHPLLIEEQQALQRRLVEIDRLLEKVPVKL